MATKPGDRPKPRSETTSWRIERIELLVYNAVTHTYRTSRNQIFFSLCMFEWYLTPVMEPFSKKFSVEDIPNLTGKVIIVTG